MKCKHHSFIFLYVFSSRDTCIQFCEFQENDIQNTELMRFRPHIFTLFQYYFITQWDTSFFSNSAQIANFDLKSWFLFHLKKRNQSCFLIKIHYKKLLYFWHVYHSKWKPNDRVVVTKSDWNVNNLIGCTKAENNI